MAMQKHDWDRVYEKYPKEEIPWEANEAEPLFLEFFNQHKDEIKTALDVGCGSGTYSVFLAKNGVDVKAFDFTKKAIDNAVELAKIENVNIDFSIEDFYNFQGKSYDLVFDRGVFHHQEVLKRERYIEKIYRMTKKYYVLICFSDEHKKSWNHFSGKEIVEMFSDIFDILAIKPFVHVHPHDGKEVHKWFVVMKK